MATSQPASKFLRHTACDACGSSDANALYDDGHTYCFNCEVFVESPSEAPQQPRKPLEIPLSLIHI